MTVTVPNAQGIEAELAQKSASVPIFELGISAFGKNAPQGRFAALLCPSALHGAQLERIARFLAQNPHPCGF
ncbi:MAG: hypothetical protein LBD20_07355 [Spirochaetaceae bacterium]|jgi:hypothetical protein|nr:hypothetical protein [Spirochaetaceae bacterium]